VRLGHEGLQGAWLERRKLGRGGAIKQRTEDAIEGFQMEGIREALDEIQILKEGEITLHPLRKMYSSAKRDDTVVPKAKGSMRERGGTQREFRFAGDIEIKQILNQKR